MAVLTFFSVPSPCHNIYSELPLCLLGRRKQSYSDNDSLLGLLRLVAEGDGLSVLAWISIVRWVGDQGRRLRWAQGWSHGKGWILSGGRCFSVCFKRCDHRGSLFGLAAPLLTSGGTVPHLRFDPVILRCFTLATGDHFSGCGTKPVLKCKKVI